MSDELCGSRWSLDINNYAAALEVIARYCPVDRMPQKTLYAWEEIREHPSSNSEPSLAPSSFVSE